MLIHVASKWVAPKSRSAIGAPQLVQQKLKLGTSVRHPNLENSHVDHNNTFIYNVFFVSSVGFREK